MIKIIIGIFLALITFLVGTLISGDIVVFFAWWLFPAYAVLLIIYFALYAVIGLMTNKPLSTKVKVLLIIPTISIPWGYTKWTEYRDAQSVQEQKIQREHELVEALTDLPPNAEIGEYDYTLYAKTDNLKDEHGNQPTFKWGNFELTSFKAPINYDQVDVISLTQPKELPHGIKCTHELGFKRKKQEDAEKGLTAEEFEFSECKVDEFALMLNQHPIQLKDFVFYYNSGLPIYKEKITTKLADLNSLPNPYWTARPQGYARIGEEWIVDDLLLILNQEGKPMILIGSAKHQTGLNNTKIDQCLIKSPKFDVILTDLQNEQATLHLIKQFSHHFSESCPETFKTSLTYSSNPLEKLQTTKVGEIKGHPILNIFNHLDDNAEVDWLPENPYLGQVVSREKPFSWGDVNLFSFRSTPSAVWAQLADDNKKLGAFSCRKNSSASFMHLLEPVDNTLAYHNFALTECTNAEGALWLENSPIQATLGQVEYVDTANKLQHKNVSNTSMLIFTPTYHDQAILTLNGFPFYLQHALTNPQGKIITLVGKIRPVNNQGPITLGKCVDAYSQLKLTHFSNKQVNVSVFEHENWENLLQENKTPECELRQISYQIEILK
ncbi:hypothetical protein [Haemophilus parainfluenzae]|jgi:hypothetical protein|uniref:hypothetical protein n=1 Tax=Haemophilus parainfluenzae TaxID=729 RepID=UPI00066DE03D|nr:hypothetical protein [Haemophilus parainfluenzae]